MRGDLHVPPPDSAHLLLQILEYKLFHEENLEQQTHASRLLALDLLNFISLHTVSSSSPTIGHYCEWVGGGGGGGYSGGGGGRGGGGGGSFVMDGGMDMKRWLGNEGHGSVRIVRVDE